MKREPPAQDEKPHQLLGELVRNVLGRRRQQDAPTLPFPRRMTRRRGGTPARSRWVAFGAGALAAGLVALAFNRGGPSHAIVYTATAEGLWRSQRLVNTATTRPMRKL